ncbi:MAG TPA: TetR/AcrR family transcriptional regulator, partial [Streptomyces sp.]|nr:TetR/AcrR family transcriptional regulator [Streptomyces sp.]
TYPVSMPVDLPAAASSPGPDEPGDPAQTSAMATVLLAAAEQELQVSGWHGTTIDRIVRRAGVSRGTFYNYFPDRKNLLHALAREHFALLMPPLTALYGLRSGRGAEARARVLALAYVQAYRRHPGVARVWSEEVRRDSELLELARLSRDTLRDAFAATFGRGAHVLTPSAFFVMLTGLTDRFPHQSTLVTDTSAAGGMSDAEVAQVIADFVVATLSLSAGRASVLPAARRAGSPETA